MAVADTIRSGTESRKNSAAIKPETRNSYTFQNFVGFSRTVARLLHDFFLSVAGAVARNAVFVADDPLL
jgi:hypothetical protein